MLTSTVLLGQQGLRLRLFTAWQPTTGSLGKLSSRGPELFAHPVFHLLGIQGRGRESAAILWSLQVDRT